MLKSCDIVSRALLLLTVAALAESLPPALPQHLLLGALVDSFLHSVLGITSWCLATSPTNKEFVAAFFSSTLIDIDHFLSAGSLNLKDAVSLPSRPLLHCSSLLLLPLLLLVLLHQSPHLRFLLLFLTCITSHHLRDSLRRGLWFCPLGETSPLPVPLYFSLLLVLPFISRFLLRLQPRPTLPLTAHEV